MYSDPVCDQVNEYWLDEMYLNVRLPLPVHSNPAMVFPRQHFTDRNSQLWWAQNIITGNVYVETLVKGAENRTVI